MVWFSIPSAGLLSPSLPCPLCINVVKLSLAQLLVNPALIDLPNCTLLFSLPLSVNWSTGQGVWRANIFIMLPANKIWIALQGTKLNLQFPLVDVIKYWFKTRGDAAVKRAYWLSCVVLCVFCQGCFAANPCVACWQGVAGPTEDIQGSGKAKGKVMCSLFGGAMDGLFRAVSLVLDIKDLLWHHAILQTGTAFKTYLSLSHTLSMLNFPWPF